MSFDLTANLGFQVFECGLFGELWRSRGLIVPFNCEGAYDIFISRDFVHTTLLRFAPFTKHLKVRRKCMPTSDIAIVCLVPHKMYRCRFRSWRAPYTLLFDLNATVQNV